jgi:hypothetical protein
MCGKFCAMMEGGLQGHRGGIIPQVTGPRKFATHSLQELHILWLTRQEVGDVTRSLREDEDDCCGY